METLNGISKNWLVLDDLRKVSDLIYYEGPLLSHYSNFKGDNYLFYWVDVDDTYNRWLVFRVSQNQLTDYVSKKISFLNVIQKIPDGFLYSVDIDDELNYNNVQVLSPSELPPSYLPKENSYYEFKVENTDALIDDIIAANDSGMLLASFKNSSKVGYGTIHLDVLSPTLQHINEMSSCLGESYFKLKQEKVQLDFKTNKRPRLNKKQVLSYTQFDVVGTLPGSFKLLLKPINTQISLPGEPTQVDDYCAFFLEFIESSFNYDELVTYLGRIDGDVIKNYEKLLKNIENFKLDFKLKWTNNLSKINIEKTITYQSVPKIIDNLTRLEYQNSSEFKMVGRFLEIHLRTRHYTFVSSAEDEEESRGYFEKLLDTTAISIKFNQTYEVTIRRMESKTTGKKAPKTEDILIAFYEVK